MGVLGDVDVLDATGLSEVLAVLEDVRVLSDACAWEDLVGLGGLEDVEVLVEPCARVDLGAVEDVRVFEDKGVLDDLELPSFW